MKKMSKNFVRVSGTAMAFGLLAFPAYAQGGGAEADENIGLEEIVVTAQKREQSLQDVPMSISAISSDTLRDSGTTGIAGVAALVPSLGVVQNNQPLAQSYRIRGLGSDPSIPTFEPSVALFIDGVYMPRSGLGVEDLVDLERVEVLKGPQSTLHGKNATAGVISVVSARPSDTFGGSIEGSLSQINGGRNATAYRVAGSLTGSIADGVRARVTGVYYDAGPIFKNLTGKDANEMKRYAVRGQLEIDLASNITLNLTGARSEVLDNRSTNADVFLGVFPEPSVALDSNPALNALFGVTACTDSNARNRIICSTDPSRSSSTSDVLSATLEADFGGTTLTAITAWSQYESQLINRDIDQVSLPLITFIDAQKGDSLSQEIRLASPSGGAFEWLLGGYYLQSDLERGDRGLTPTFEFQSAIGRFPLAPGVLPPQVVYGQPGDKGYQDSRASSKYFAVFGQVKVELSDQFALTGGLRWQTEKKEASLLNRATFTPNPNLPAGHPLAGINLLTTNLVPAVTFPGGVPINGALPTIDDDNVTWNFTGNYTPNDNTLIYVTNARGSKSGGHNIGFGSAVPAIRQFGAEKVDHYEIGAKLDTADRRARLSVSVFRSDYTNYQSAGFVGLQFLVNNAEDVRITGAEFEGTIRVSNNFTLNVGGAYLDAKFSTYTAGACYFGRAPDANRVNGAFTSCDLSGQPLPLTPKLRLTSALQYEQNVGLGDLYARGDISWQDDVNVASASLDPRLEQKAHAIVNARLGLRLDNGLDVSVWASNVFNQTVAQQAGALGLFGTTSGYQQYLGAPRQFGGTVRFSF
jgi:outer membrane receptor protein involved in Fe transport